MTLTCLETCESLGPIGQNLLLAAVFAWGLFLKWRLARAAVTHTAAVAAKDDVIKVQAVALSHRPGPPTTPVQMPSFPAAAPVQVPSFPAVDLWPVPEEETPAERPAAKRGEDDRG